MPMQRSMFARILWRVVLGQKATNPLHIAVPACVVFLSFLVPAACYQKPTGPTLAFLLPFGKGDSGYRLQKQRRPPIKATDCWPAQKKKEVHEERIQFVVVLIHESEYMNGSYHGIVHGE
eukprot:1154770-Pelagomonas_calceolata.AAC.2